MRWKKSGFIDDSTYRKLLTTNGNLSRAYDLTKIHKPDYPLRVIVSSINSPLYFLFLFLHNIIVNSIAKAYNYIKNGFHNREIKWNPF